LHDAYFIFYLELQFAKIQPIHKNM